MLSIFRNLTSNTLFRYVFVGGVSFVIEIAALYLLVSGLHTTSLVAVAISFWVGLLASFILQKLVAFKDPVGSPKRLLRQSIAYAILVIVNYFFTITFVALLEAALGLFIARTLALIITTGWNFIVYSKIIFKKELKD